MKRCALGTLLQCGWVWALVSCDQERLLGEDRCYGANTVCASDAPTRPLNAEEGQVFDVIAARSIAPLWQREVPCERSCGGRLASGPAGGVWAYTIDGSGGKSMLVSDDGQIARSYATEPGASLSVDRELNAQLLSAKGRALRIARFGRAGERGEHALEVPPSFGPDIFHIGIHPSADGSVRVGAASAAGSYVAKYDGEGTLVWKQTDLRAARRFPFEDLGPGAVPPVSYGMLPLADGSLAVILPKYDGVDGEPLVLTGVEF